MSADGRAGSLPSTEIGTNPCGGGKGGNLGGVVGGIMGDGLRLGDSYWQLTLLPPGVLFPFKANVGMQYQLIPDIICAQHCVTGNVLY